MATRVGAFTPGTNDAAGGTIATSSKATTTPNLIWGLTKWESNAGVAVACSSVTDTAGNTYTLVGNVAAAASDTAPGICLFYCLNATGNAANIVTANYDSANAVFRRIFAEEWSGLASVDGTVKTGSGTGTAYSTASTTTTGTGLVVAGVAGFTALTGITAGGTPTFTLGNTLTDAFVEYLISNSAQTVSPAASATGSALWKMDAIAFLDSVTSVSIAWVKA